MSDRPKRKRTLFSFFERINKDQNTNETHSPSSIDAPILDDQPRTKSQRVDVEYRDTNSLVRDPGLRRPISSYDVNQREEIRRAYINMGPCHPKLMEYPGSLFAGQMRRFQHSWFTKFPWLEYSEAKDSVFCFPCFIFDKNQPASPIFTVEGHSNWKRVGGKECIFAGHEGGSNSEHCKAMLSWHNLKDTSRHIDNMLVSQSSQEVFDNRLRLKATIDVVKLLALKAFSFRGHDEYASSLNRGNFIELLKYSAKLSPKINSVVLDNAPSKAKYIAPLIQKEILHILANKVRYKIREEIGEDKYCILVDEALDESKEEQMAIILRYVDRNGFIRERFFEVVGVENTMYLTLKTKISNVLDRYNLSVQNMRGQGYDGASNMRGAWNGLQALFLKDCPYAYYVHCFAHRLQLALVSASKEVHDVWLFYSKLSSVINIANSSAKLHSELKATQETEVQDMIASGELVSGQGANQTRTLQRAGATRWSSHFKTS